jgi:hypothetical protein
LPQPTLSGPEIRDEQGKESSQTIQSLQARLTKWGFFGGEQDGTRSLELSTAIDRTVAHLDGDGTDRSVSAIRNTLSDRRGCEKYRETPVAPLEVAKFWVDQCPRNLRRDSIVHELQSALRQWGYDPVAMDSAEESNVIIRWQPLSLNGQLDGKGKELARTVGNTVILDSAEKWLTQEMNIQRDSYRFLPVILHELGHLLFGKPHVDVVGAVMSAFYNPLHITLTTDDLKGV